tara:strand:- start:359 stop:577 length:219 start_codon:yes stop_codon:yes gene_type:complete
MLDSNTTNSTIPDDFDKEVESYLRLIKRCVDGAIETYENGDLIMALAATRNARSFINHLDEFACDIAHGWVN